MLGLLTALHVIICVLLITIILIQQGKGGGLVEMASGVESIFGTKTSSFIAKTTAVLATAFLCSSLVIAFLSARQSRSLMESAASVASAADSSIKDISKPQPPAAVQEQAEPVPQPQASVPEQAK